MNGETMMSDAEDDMVRRAQATALFTGAEDALSFSYGGMTPRLTSVALVFEGTVGSEEIAGLIGLRSDGGDITEIDTVAMLGYAVAQLAEHVSQTGEA
jgi:hypothetical protein